MLNSFSMDLRPAQQPWYPAHAQLSWHWIVKACAIPGARWKEMLPDMHEYLKSRKKSFQILPFHLIFLIQFYILFWHEDPDLCCIHCYCSVCFLRGSMCSVIIPSVSRESLLLGKVSIPCLLSFSYGLDSRQ